MRLTSVLLKFGKFKNDLKLLGDVKCGYAREARDAHFCPRALNLPKKIDLLIHHSSNLELTELSETWRRCFLLVFAAVIEN